MTIAITGGRDYRLQPQDWFWLGQQMGEFHRDGFSRETILILHGAARGVDTEASEALRRYGFRIEACPANWDVFGKRAGFMRNREMADRAGWLLAFPGGRGTQNMVDICHELLVSVLESPTRKAP